MTIFTQVFTTGCYKQRTYATWKSGQHFFKKQKCKNNFKLAGTVTRKMFCKSVKWNKSFSECIVILWDSRYPHCLPWVKRENSQPQTLTNPSITKEKKCTPLTSNTWSTLAGPHNRRPWLVSAGCTSWFFGSVPYTLQNPILNSLFIAGCVTLYTKT